jgi:hypothetical protein
MHTTGMFPARYEQLDLQKTNVAFTKKEGCKKKSKFQRIDDCFNAHPLRPATNFSLSQPSMRESSRPRPTHFGCAVGGYYFLLLAGADNPYYVRHGWKPRYTGLLSMLSYITIFQRIKELNMRLFGKTSVSSATVLRKL